MILAFKGKVDKQGNTITMKLCIKISFLLFLITAASSTEAVESRKFILDNGLTVIVNEMPSTPVAAVFAWVKTGSANEGKYLGSGITHFVEHMIFKGTARRAPGAIPEEAKSLGGYINASTGQDFTVFTLSLPKENFVQGVDLIADMMRNASFDPQEVEHEREVILKEMRMLNDRPDRKLDDLVNAHVYVLHPYRLSIIGREKMFRTISREDLLDYYRTYYAPNNIILSVAGQFTAEDVLPVIKEKFGDAPAKTTPMRNLPEEPEQIASRSYEESYSTDLYRMVLAYQGVPLLHRDLYALDLLASALGSGRSSRFYRRLYEEKQLVNSIAAWNDTPIDKGFFEISCLMKEDNRKEVTQEVKAIIDEVKRSGLRPEELSKVKRQAVVENIKSREVASGMAYRSAMEEAFTGNHLFSDSYVQGIKRVKNNDIKKVAKTYLIDERLTEVSLTPPVSGQAMEDKKTTSAMEIEKVVLGNGITLLLKEDKTLPVVAINLMMRAGIQQEPEGLEGLASLTGTIWGKAYKGITPDMLSREIEQRGGAVSTRSGKNTFALSMSFLSDDLPFALDVLEKLLKEPSFPSEVIDRERQQMITAIASRKDSVMQTAYKELLETLFLTHPFRRDGLGSVESLGKISRKNIVDFYRFFSVPSNMVISIYGDINKEKIIKHLTDRLGALPTRTCPIKNFEESAPDSRRERELLMDKEQSAVLYGFRAPVISSDEAPAVEVAVNVLSSSLGGRLFKRIRDELGKSYALGGTYSPSVDAGTVTFFSLTTAENISKVRSIMEEEFLKIARETVSEKELLDAKAYLKGDHARDLETLNAQSDISTTHEILGLGYTYSKSYNTRIDKVDKDTVRAVAKKYFSIDHAAVVVVRGAAVSQRANDDVGIK